MAIKIVSDRMLDLSKQELADRNIDTIGCFVNMGGASYTDMEDIFPSDVFDYLDKTGKMAQTAAKSADSYYDFFKPFVDNGDTVIHFAASSGISSIAENARIASLRFDNKVFVIDTLKLSNGIAVLVNYAQRLIDEGETDAAKIAELVRQKIPKVQCSFLLDRLDCLYKGGRCSTLTFYAANILRIKPVIHMDKTGHMLVREKYRGSREKVLDSYIKTTFAKFPNPELDVLYVTYATYNEQIQNQILNTVAKYYNFASIQFNATGCNCSIHSGRNTIGLFYMQK